VTSLGKDEFLYISVYVFRYFRVLL